MLHNEILIPHNLNADVFFRIHAYLPKNLQQIFIFLQVSKGYFHVFTNDIFWKPAHQHHYPITHAKLKNIQHSWYQQFSISFKDEYKDMLPRERNLFFRLKERDPKILAENIYLMSVETKDKYGMRFLEWVSRLNYPEFNHYFKNVFWQAKFALHFPGTNLPANCSESVFNFHYQSNCANSEIFFDPFKNERQSMKFINDHDADGLQAFLKDKNTIGLLDFVYAYTPYGNLSAIKQIIKLKNQKMMNLLFEYMQIEIQTKEKACMSGFGGHSIIYWAIQTNQIKFIEEYLQQDNQINETYCGTAITPIQLTIELGRIEILKKLLKYDPAQSQFDNLAENILFCYQNTVGKLDAIKLLFALNPLIDPNRPKELKKLIAIYKKLCTYIPERGKLGKYDKQYQSGFFTFAIGYSDKDEKDLAANALKDFLDNKNKSSLTVINKIHGDALNNGDLREIFDEICKLLGHSPIHSTFQLPKIEFKWGS